MAERAFDVIVIGAGPAGEVVAGRLAERGHATAIVESRLVGGECSFYACMPSKALLRPAELLGEARRVPGVREALDGALHPAAVLRRRDEVIHNLDDSAQVPWLEERGVVLVRGHGRLEGERAVRVGDERLRARRAVVVATGSEPAMPPIPGLAAAQPWTNREATTSTVVPPRLLVLGGGVVGVEIRTAVQATAVARPRPGEAVTLTLDDGSELTGDELLVAVGRRPATATLGLDTLGLTPGEYLPVDDRLRVAGHDWLYAIGDANGRSLLTHMGKYQAHIASRVIDGDPSARAARDDAGSPRVIFTDPQVAAVGLTEAAAREAGIAVRTVGVDTSASAGGSFVGRGTGGTSQLVVDAASGVIVGATFVGFEVAEWLHAATIAVTAAAPIDRLWHCVPAFPTRSEVWLRLLEAYEAG